MRSGLVEVNRVSGVFTSPTAVRLLMKYGREPSRRHDLRSLSRVFCAGEVLNAPAWDEIIKIAGHRIGTIEVETRSCVTWRWRRPGSPTSPGTYPLDRRRMRT